MPIEAGTPSIESTPQTIEAVLALQAERQPDAPAILAPGRKALSYALLGNQVQRTVLTLRGYGVGRSHRVALVLPNGPELAVAFVAVAAGAASAPLNPAYRAEEFDFYLSDIQAAALIVEQGSDSPAIGVAEAQGIPVLELHPTRDEAAGIFSLQGSPAATGGTSASAEVANPGQVGLLLHTSGTTSRPKLVPLTQANLCASAFNISRTLALTPNDRCLNVMPLFHIHGLIGAVLATLAAGASVVATPGFDAMKFYAWLEEFQPTWYTAVPTMHQMVLARSARNQETVAKSQLRFVRSSSASLPPQVMRELESVFRAPVIESYGMTEAAHQMASNPLPPASRKPGSVGVAAGPEIGIMDDNGQLLPADQTSEVVIRGANVTGGYEKNAEANENAFTNGWFRTGDQGYLDPHGYLYITGRLKEIINRGGEKISPREVDEVLLDHPSVQQAVTFAMPHKRLGEDVAAAIVLKEGSSASDKEIREFARERLADFKTPSRVVFLKEIPKGPTGKLQRIGLAEKLGLA